MKKSRIAIVALMALSLTPLFAFQNDCIDDCIANGGSERSCAAECNDDKPAVRDPNSHGNSGSDNFGWAIQFLELTPDQIDEWETLLSDKETAEEPLAGQLAVLVSQLPSRDDPNIDATLLGQMVLDIRALQEQIREIASSTHLAMVSILSPQQTTKLALRGLTTSARQSSRTNGVVSGNRNPTGGGRGN